MSVASLQSLSERVADAVYEYNGMASSLIRIK